MINLGAETETVEFKKSTSELKEAIISIVAMLNKHQKGEVYFGVRDDGMVIGQDISSKTLRDVADEIANHIEPKIFPTIDVVTLDWKRCVYVSFEGHNLPYFAYNIARIRIADEDRVMSQQELVDFIKRRNNHDYDWENRISDISIDEIDEEELKDYVKRGQLASRLSFSYVSKEDTLKRLSLIKDDHILNAAAVLFSKSIYSELQMAVFAGTERLTFLDIQRERDNIFNLVKIAEEYIFKKTNTSVEITGLPERIETYEFPEEAIREALINSFCHKDYGSCQSNEVVVFEDRIEIYNPGKFPSDLTPDDFINGRESSRPRNPLIARVLYYSKNIESFGTGLRRIKESCDSFGCKFEFMNTKTGFRVIFYRKKFKKNYNDDESGSSTFNTKGLIKNNKVKGKASKEDILSFCESPKSTIEIMENFGLKSRKNFVDNYLTPLLNDGKIDYLFPNKLRSRNQKYVTVQS